MPLLYTAAVLHWLALGQGDGGVPPPADDAAAAAAAATAAAAAAAAAPPLPEGWAQGDLPDGTVFYYPTETPTKIQWEHPSAVRVLLFILS